MNCPKCGSPTFAEQQFCRSCGATLIEAERRMIPPQFWGLAMAFGGILIALSGKMADLRWLVFAGVFISIAGMFLIAAIPLLRRSAPRKNRAAASQQPHFLTPTGITNKMLPLGQNDFISSVTDRTTELLKQPASLPHDRSSDSAI